MGTWRGESVRDEGLMQLLQARVHLPTKCVRNGVPNQVYTNVFQGGLVCKAHRIVDDSTLGSRVIEKKKTKVVQPA